MDEWIADFSADCFVVAVQLLNPSSTDQWMTQLAERFLPCLSIPLPLFHHTLVPTLLSSDDCRMVSYSVAKTMCTCLFVKSWLAPYMSNINACAVRLAQRGTKKSSLRADRVAGITGKNGSVKDDTATVGGAISFCLNDTSFCFLNVYFEPGNPAHTWDQRTLLLSGGVDIDIDFDCAFVCGTPWQRGTSSLRGCLQGDWCNVAPQSPHSVLLARTFRAADALTHCEPVYLSAGPAMHAVPCSCTFTAAVKPFVPFFLDPAGECEVFSFTGMSVMFAVSCPISPSHTPSVLLASHCVCTHVPPRQCEPGRGLTGGLGCRHVCADRVAAV